MLPSDFSKLTPIDTGEFSRAFFVNRGEEEIVLRLNPFTDEGFKKEEIVHEQLPMIPTPQILERGSDPESGEFFAFSKKLAGTQLHLLDESAREAVSSDLFRVMNVIYQNQLNGNQGRGKWGVEQKGEDTHWARAVWRFVRFPEWERLRRECSFLEVDLLQKLLAECQFLDQVSNYGYFIHGDFGRTNVIADQGKISGIIDWSESMFGDFVWDVVWINFWSKSFDYTQAFYEFASSQTDLDLTSFFERVQLYQNVIGINTLLFAAQRNDRQTYQEARDILLSSAF